MKKIRNYNGDTRVVSNRVFELMRRNGAPGFVGRYREFVNKYMEGEMDGETLVNTVLVEVTNEYS